MDKVQRLIDEAIDILPRFKTLIEEVKTLDEEERRDYANKIYTIPGLKDLLSNKMPTLSPTSKSKEEQVQEISKALNKSSISSLDREKFSKLMFEQFGDNPFLNIQQELEQDPKYKDFDFKSNPETSMKIMMPILISKVFSNKEITNSLAEEFMNDPEFKSDLDKYENKKDLL